MITAIIAINPQMLSQSILDVTKIAVGPSAPPIIPMEAASLPQPVRHNTKVNKKENTIVFFIKLFSFFHFLFI